MTDSAVVEEATVAPPLPGVLVFVVENSKLMQPLGLADILCDDEMSSEVMRIAGLEVGVYWTNKSSMGPAPILDRLMERLDVLSNYDIARSAIILVGAHNDNVSSNVSLDGINELLRARLARGLRIGCIAFGQGMGSLSRKLGIPGPDVIFSELTPPGAMRAIELLLDSLPDFLEGEGFLQPLPAEGELS